VKVIASNLGNSLRVIGRPEYCIGSGDSAVLQVENALVINWFKNQQRISGENTSTYRVPETGVYHAFLRDEFGCSAQTKPQSINISSIPSAVFNLNDPVQCLAGNQFIFGNTSTNAVGAMQYHWSYDGTGFAMSRDVVYSFTETGSFRVKLVVRTNSLCADSMDIPVTIYPNPVPLFDAPAICEGMSFGFNNRTDENIGSPVSYSWSISGSPYSSLRIPPPRLFNTPGLYQVTLSVNSEQCPSPLQSLTKTIEVETAAPSIRYPISFALRDVPMMLEARKIGVSAQWAPAVYLSETSIYSPVFKGATHSEYTITLTTEGGCTTVDTLQVQVAPKADIQVPTAFTPNSDGLNDFLRPILIGIKNLQYFRIYNRWGEQVYSTIEARPGWDGTFKGKLQPSQPYIWMTEGVSITGEVITKKGTAILIR
jgi:gliding motility-associated-like protein